MKLILQKKAALPLLAILLTVCYTSWGQTTIFSENMGTPGGTTSIAANSFQNSGTLTYSGTADVRNTTVSTGYVGASGGGNVFVTGTVGVFFQISGINTTSYTGLTLSLGHFKSTTAGNNELIIEVSSDGTTYTPLTYTRATGSGTANWILITPTGTIPSTANLRIRFRQTSTPQFRIDDVKLAGNLAPTTPTVISTSASTITEVSAVLNGTINANNLSTVTSFEYGTSITYGATVAGTPSSLSNNVTTAITGAIAGLIPNTQYHFRAVGTVSGTPTNGSDMSFYTLANVPNAPTVNNATVNSLDVTIDNLSQNGNPGITQYAIQEIGGNFVQASGSLGATAVFQTAAAWATVTVTGLSSNTSYTFQLQARNGNNAVTSFGTSESEMTLPNLSANVILVSALPAFGNVCTNTSATGSFTVDGENLDGSDIVVGPLDGYTFSDTQNGSYTGTLNISYGGTSFTNRIVWVAFAPSLVQSYDGDIPINGGALASTVNVAASGSGVNIAITAATGAASGTTAVSSVLSATIDEGCTDVSAYGIEYSTINGFADGNGIPETGSNLSSNAFSVTLSGLEPNIIYYYKAFATDSNVTAYGIQQSFITSNIEAPAATDASDITQDSFTANWTEVPSAASYRLDVSTNPAFSVTTNTADLFISEYVEGSSNNKYIEIYNGTGLAVNLSNYELRLFANGTSTPTNSQVLSGTLANGAVIVYKNASAAVYGGAATNGSAINYNGDDAIGLWKVSASAYVDIFGRIGEDPGTAWTGSGFTTLDRTLVRNANVMQGVSTNPSSGFPTLTTQWTQSGIDTVSSLGSHTINNVTPSFLSGYQNLTVSGASQVVTGLTENTNYYYRVRAVSANSTSVNSNVITVLTAPAMPTFDAITQAVGVVCEDTAATFNVTGLLPDSTSTISYNIDGGPTQTVTDVIANASGFATFEIVLSLANNAQTLTVTSVERTDLPGGTITVTTNNTVLLSVNANATFYVDGDGDGYGSPSAPTVVDCTMPPGYALNNTDCNDNIAAINPGQPEILYDGVDNNCNNQLDEGFQMKTKLLPEVCGATLASISSLIGITTVSSSITMYRIRVTNGSTVQIIERNVPHFVLPNLPSYDYATTYTVEIELQRNGIWLGYYGDPCLVSSPAVLVSGGATQVNPSQCGITLARINTLVATTSLAGATGYRFKVTNITAGASGPNVIQTIDRVQHWFSLVMLTQYNYGSTYRVEVAVKTNGVYSGFGAPCEVSSPAAPTLINCGGVVTTPGTLIAATSLPGVTQYRFQITRMSDNATTTIDRNTNSFNFNMVPGYTPAAQYAVRVAVMTVGTWSPFGDACEITSPGAGARYVPATETTTASDSFRAAAYPNPFASTFAIDVTSSLQANVQIRVYDMTGRLIETREATASDLNSLQVGDRYPSGVYNVIVTQGENVETLRVIKR